MSVLCPNHTRRKRKSLAGGALGCERHLEVVLLIPVVIPAKSLRDPRDPDRTLPRYVLRHGVRVTPQQILKAFDSRTTHDIRCGCGWSLNALRGIERATGTPTRKRGA